MKNSPYLPKYLRVKTTLQNLLITLILFACTASFTAEVVNDVKTSTTTNNKLAPKKNTTLTNVQNTVKIGNQKQNKTIPAKTVTNINANKQKNVNTKVANNKKVTVANKKIGNKPTQQIVSKKTIVQKKNTIQNNKNVSNTTKVGIQKQDKGRFRKNELVDPLPSPLPYGNGNIEGTYLAVQIPASSRNLLRHPLPVLYEDRFLLHGT